MAANSLKLCCRVEGQCGEGLSECEQQFIIDVPTVLRNRFQN